MMEHEPRDVVGNLPPISDPETALRIREIAELREANQHLLLETLRVQSILEDDTQYSRIQEQFLPMLAHELRNPLAPIMNALAVLDRLPDTGPTVSWVHDVIKRQADHLARLLDDLLEVARLKTGKVVLQKRPIELGKCLDVAIEARKPLLERRGQRLEWEPPRASLLLEGDPVRLAQLFSNLLDNASKFSAEGGVIQLSIDRIAPNAVVRIADHGTGVSADALPHVFDLFMQEARTLGRSQGGLGIGLAVVRSLVELHGGEVEAYSGGVNQGSEFVVTLPLAPAVLSDRDERVPLRPLQAAAGLRIVLIEDNEDSNESLCTLLRMMGHEVESAVDGRSGVGRGGARHAREHQ
jgi:signal transduction histidine kinase